MPEAERPPTRNPFALPAARAVSARHVAGATGLAATDATGRSIVWPCRIRRLAPGLSAIEAPRHALYDTHGDPAVEPAAAADLLERLLERLLDARALPAGSPHVLIARNLIAEGPVWAALETLARRGAIRLDIIARWERAVLDRSAAPDWSAFLATSLSPKRLKRLRQKHRALERLGRVHLAVAQTPEDVAAAFDAFTTLEATGWKGRARTALAQQPAGRAYVRDMMLTCAAERNAFALMLDLAGRTIAAGLFIRAGGETTFWKTAYDEGLSHHSPGVVFDLLATEWLYGQSWFELLDAGHDDSVDPASLIWSERRPMASAVIDLKPGSIGGLAVAGILRARQRLRAWRNKRQSVP